MRIIIKIAKSELRMLFYSPIAWLISVVFFIICGVQFLTPLVELSRAQEINLENMANWKGFDKALSFSLFAPTIASVIGYLYLFLPLITMGVINREVSTGSMKLLYSSPIRTRDIILGKYMGLMAFNMVLLFIVSTFLAVGYYSILHVEYQWYLAVLLAIFLLSNAYAAIGLFISCLTTYQIVAGLATFVVFFLLNSIGMLWQQYDFIRELTYFLAISGRVEKLVLGLINSKDILYFLLIILLFLGFALIKLKHTQESRSWRVSFFRYSSLSAIVLLLGYLSSRPKHVAYLDITRLQHNTIAPATQEVLKEMDGSPLTITLYTNALGRNANYGDPRKRNEYIWNFWGYFQRFYPNIHFKFDYYYRIPPKDHSIKRSFPNKTEEDIAREFTKMLGMRFSIFQPWETIKEKVNLDGEEFEMIMELEYKHKKAFLRAYPDMQVWPNQNHISGTIRRLVRDTVPSILFTSGSYERNPFKLGEREYANHTGSLWSRKALINKGVDIDTISLTEKDIPENLSVLVMVDPKSILTDIDNEKIISYLNRGGNAVFYAEPGKQEILNTVLNTIGVHLEPGIIVQESYNHQPHELVANLTKAATLLAEEEGLYYYKSKGEINGQIDLIGAVSIAFNDTTDFKIEPLLTIPGNSKTWLETGHLVIDSIAPTYSTTEGDIKKENYVTAIQLSRVINNKEQRIIISGEADFMSNRAASGAILGNAFYSWVLYNEYPVYHNTEQPVDTSLTISRSAGKRIWNIYIYIVPACILLLGIIILLRRKRK